MHRWLTFALLSMLAFPVSQVPAREPAPVDAGSDPLLVTNVTSNGYAMAAETAAYVANRIGGAGSVVMFVYDPFPPVQVRGHIADAVFSNFPDIKVINRVTPVFKTIADFRKDHPEAIAGVCRAFIKFCREQSAFGGEVLAIDGSKIAAVASRKQVITPKR